MSRKLTTFTVTSAASGSSITWTNSTTVHLTGSGATTFYAMGLFPSIVKSATNPAPLFWETLFSGSFTVTNNGDTLRLPTPLLRPKGPKCLTYLSIMRIWSRPLPRGPMLRSGNERSWSVSALSTLWPSLTTGQTMTIQDLAAQPSTSALQRQRVRVPLRLR